MSLARNDKRIRSSEHKRGRPVRCFRGETWEEVKAKMLDTGADPATGIWLSALARDPGDPGAVPWIPPPPEEPLPEASAAPASG